MRIFCRKFPVHPTIRGQVGPGPPPRPRPWPWPLAPGPWAPPHKMTNDGLTPHTTPPVLCTTVHPHTHAPTDCYVPRMRAREELHGQRPSGELLFLGLRHGRLRRHGRLGARAAAPTAARAALLPLRGRRARARWDRAAPYARGPPAAVEHVQDEAMRHTVTRMVGRNGGGLPMEDEAQIPRFSNPSPRFLPMWAQRGGRHIRRPSSRACRAYIHVKERQSVEV